MRALASLLVASLLCLAATACEHHEVDLHDDIDLTWNLFPTFDPLDGRDEPMHTPYARGADVGLSVTLTNRSAGKDWHIVSSDPTVFAITDNPDDRLNSARGYAAGPGTARVAVVDGSGNEIDGEDIEVVTPDRVRLYSHAYLLIDDAAGAPITELRLLAGGTATFLARYYAGDRLLNGIGLLSGDSDGDVAVEARQSWFGEDREWLTVTAGATTGTGTGTGTVHLYADGIPLANVPLTTVGEDAIDHVDILGANEHGKHKDDWIAALAQSYDAAGKRIFAVDYTWSVDDTNADGEGDLYEYQYNPGPAVMLGARRGQHFVEKPLHVGDGYVASSNDVACAIAGGPASRGLGDAAPLGLLGLGALVLPRRRRGR